MEELLASMHDLTGSHVLPILAAHVHASPQPVPRPLHDSAAGASVSEQLAALKALQQEGAQALSDTQVCCAFSAEHPHRSDSFMHLALSNPCLQPTSLCCINAQPHSMT